MTEQTATSESDATRAADGGTPTADSVFFRLGHLVLGGVLAFMAIDNIRSLDDMIGYAEANGAPLPEVTVPSISGLLLWGSVGISLWRYPALAASAVAAFFVSVTPLMHDFWSVDDPQQRQQQTIHFMKNTALLGAVLALLGLGRDSR